MPDRNRPDEPIFVPRRGGRRVYKRWPSKRYAGSYRYRWVQWRRYLLKPVPLLTLGFGLLLIFSVVYAVLVIQNTSTNTATSTAVAVTATGDTQRADSQRADSQRADSQRTDDTSNGGFNAIITESWDALWGAFRTQPSAESTIPRPDFMGTPIVTATPTVALRPPSFRTVQSANVTTTIAAPNTVAGANANNGGTAAIAVLPPVMAISTPGSSTALLPIVPSTVPSVPTAIPTTPPAPPPTLPPPTLPPPSLPPPSLQPSTAPAAPVLVNLAPQAAILASITADQSRDTCNPPNVTDYRPTNLTDENLATAWRVSGNGINQAVRFDFGATVRVHAVNIVPGYAKTDPCTPSLSWCQRNRIPKTIMLNFADGSSQTMHLAQSCTWQGITLPTPVQTNWLQFTILDSYPSIDKEFTPISEITIIGER